MLRKRTLWTMVSLMILVSLFVTACQNTATSSGGAEDEELVFGVILVGPYNDHGWSEA
ncbi:MAG TPA: hypothetical protein GX702_12140, partial [Chloroflexi bacterium]|nr:hypothetical protein [Chloroflexota bacterium]